MLPVNGNSMLSFIIGGKDSVIEHRPGMIDVGDLEYSIHPSGAGYSMNCRSARQPRNVAWPSPRHLPGVTRYGMLCATWLTVRNLAALPSLTTPVSPFPSRENTRIPRISTRGVPRGNEVVTEFQRGCCRTWFAFLVR